MTNVEIIVDVFTKAVLPDLEAKLEDSEFLDLLAKDPETALKQLFTEIIIDSLKRVLADELGGKLEV
jgi:hypothetical protein